MNIRLLTALAILAAVPGSACADKLCDVKDYGAKGDGVSKDTAAAYARDRAHKHAHVLREIAEAVDSGRTETAQRLADGWNRADNLFPGLDARRLPGRHGGPR